MGAPDHATRTLSLSVRGQPVPTPCDVLGEGPRALLLPALSSISSREEMQPLAAQLSPYYRCLIPEWPGFGAQDRARLPLDPANLHAFLDALLGVEPGPYALGIGAGHAATYLAAAARRYPGLFERLILVAPTWRGPLPTVMGPHRAGLFSAIRRTVALPLVGEALYRANLSRPVIGRMMRAHVYAEPANVSADVVEAKHRIARQRGGRFGTAAFVTGGLDPVANRDAFHALFEGLASPAIVLRPRNAPRRSGMEMDALIATGRVRSSAVPGALSPHEEYPGEVAEAIRAA